MITIIIGTKGQFIKMAPIMIELEKRGHDYLYINASQHVHSLNKVMKSFKVKKPDITMWNFGKDVSNTKEIIKWLMINLFKYTMGCERKTFKIKDKNIILVHGDAPPVILGQLLGLFHRINVGHIEAGLRSNNYFSPFPEEIIRISSDKLSNLLFPLSDFAFSNIKDKYSKKIIKVRRNTVYDAVMLAVDQTNKIKINNYVLASVHRYETLQSKSNLSLIIDIIINIAKDYKILFTIHESTKKALIKYNLLTKISNSANIILTPLINYFKYINYVKHANFLITDGGGPQEESYYLGTPCLVLRRSTERLIWKNVCLGGFNMKIIHNFLNEYEKYRIPPLNDNYSPSKEIVDNLEKLGYID